MIDGARGQAGRPHKRLVPPAYADGRGKNIKSLIYPLLIMQHKFQFAQNHAAINLISVTFETWQKPDTSIMLL